MDWHDYIQADPEILAGKPVVKGTRLAVEFLLGGLDLGPDPLELSHPHPGGTSGRLCFRRGIPSGRKRLLSPPPHRLNAGVEANQIRQRSLR